MFLTDEEKAMLDGSEGLAVQKAMEILVHYGEALGADHLVDTKNVGGYLIARKDQMKKANTDSFDTLFSELNIDSDRPFEFGHVKVPSCQFETDMEPDYYRLSDPALLQFGKLFFSLLTLKFQNTQMLLVFALLLPLNPVLQHDFRKSFFFFLYPQVALRQRSPLTSNALVGKRLFQRYTGG